MIHFTACAECYIADKDEIGSRVKYMQKYNSAYSCVQRRQPREVIVSSRELEKFSVHESPATVFARWRKWLGSFQYFILAKPANTTSEAEKG